ncbi:MAG: methyltransferase domain-containing protein [Planctomycetota bacterium]
MTLERILEPEVMDSPREAQEYNDMDHSEVNQRFVSEMLSFLETDEWFANRLDTETDGVEESTYLDALDVGTGTALIPIELCERHAEFRVMAIDMAISMLELARYNIASSVAGHRIELGQVDAKTMGYDTDAFDLVMSNSIIHHIPEPVECVEQMVRVVRPGGAIFIRDLMRPTDAETLDQIVQTYAGHESEYSRKLFRDSLHASLSLEEMRALAVKFGFAAETVLATSDRHWTWAAIVPEIESDA